MVAVADCQVCSAHSWQLPHDWASEAPRRVLRLLSLLAACRVPTGGCPSPQVRRARAKKNRDLAARLAARKPSYRLDHLVRER